MSTYLIVLMQFKLTLLRQGARKTVTAIVRAIFNTTITDNGAGGSDEDQE